MEVLKRAIAIVYSGRRTILRATLLAFALLIVVQLIVPRRFTASASFVPASRRGGSSLGGLAAQLGVAVPVQNADQSPGFYAELLVSRDLLRAAVRGRYATSAGGADSASFAELQGATSAELDEKDLELTRELRRRVDVTTDARTGIVRFNVFDRNPAVAAGLGQRLLMLVDEFNRAARQNQARAERAFTEGRIAELNAELLAAEERLEEFLRRNRDNTAPALAFQRARLERDVSTRREIFISLSQAFEQARIDAVRDTPLISVIESPVVPARPDSREWPTRGFVAILLGALAGVLATISKARGWMGRGGFPSRSSSA